VAGGLLGGAGQTSGEQAFEEGCQEVEGKERGSWTIMQLDLQKLPRLSKTEAVKTSHEDIFGSCLRQRDIITALACQRHGKKGKSQECKAWHT
jgi:hypothetical protein